MDSRYKAVIGDAHQVISDVENKGAFYRSCIQPLSVSIQNLKATILVLPEHGEELKIRMRTDADGLLLILQSALWNRRVIVECNRSIRVRGHGVKMIFGQVQGESKCPHQSPSSRKAGSPVLNHGFLEAGDIRSLVPTALLCAETVFDVLWDRFNVIDSRIVVGSYRMPKLSR